jgi:hypothetical protein
MTVTLKPEREEAERFLATLDPSASCFCFQTFDDDKSRKDLAFAQTLHGSLDRHWDTLCRLNAAGAGVFFRVNEPDRVRATFVDLAGLPLPVQYRWRPQLVTETAPRRYCLFWIVEGCPVDQFPTLMRGLFALHNTSAADCDLARVMRLPGFYSYGRMGKFRVRLVTRLITDESELADELYIEDELDREEERRRMLAEVREAEDE